MTPLDLLLSRWDIAINKLAFLLDISPVTIHKWRRVYKGKIPKKYHNRILELAKFRSKRCLITKQELESGKNG